jgi:hypothetical protein
MSRSRRRLPSDGKRAILKSRGWAGQVTAWLAIAAGAVASRSEIPRRSRRALLLAAAALALAVGALASAGPGAPAARAATSLPCDIYAAGGTPCTTAYSTIRALYASYDGSLYQV